MKLICKEIEMTKALALEISKLLTPGDVLCLSGDLGAGKTTFTKFLVSALGVDQIHVTSPSYTIVNEYHGKFKVNHFDVYRLFSIEELYEIGFEEYIYSEDISIIEWANKVEEILPKDSIWIDIRLGKNPDERIFKIRENNLSFINKLKEVL